MLTWELYSYNLSKKQATAVLPSPKITHCKLSYKWTIPQTVTHPHAEKNYYGMLKKERTEDMVSYGFVLPAELYDIK